MPPLPEAEASGSWERPLRSIALVGSPIALGTALLFYFGWVRADAQARALGYDVTLLGLTASDYVLRSINVLYFPLAVVLIGCVVLVTAEPWLLRALSRPQFERRRDKVLALARYGWLICVLIGLVAALLLPVTRAVVIPFALTAGVLLTLYSFRLRRLLLVDEPPPDARRALVVALLCVLVFWDVERVASAMGRGFGADIIERPQRFSAVTVYSAKRLEISTPHSVETPINSKESAYGYRYQGLRLLLYANDRYILFDTRQREREAVIVVLTDENSVRVEFARR